MSARKTFKESYDDHIDRKLQRQKKKERKAVKFHSSKKLRNLQPEDFLDMEEDEWDEYDY